ncbi:MAG: hypothetical protein AB9866_19025 [Syntrophobacteraceae bacterium]
MKTVIGTGKDTSVSFTLEIKGLDTLIKNLGNPGVKEIFTDAANRAISVVNVYAQREVPKKSHLLAQSHSFDYATPMSLHAEVYTEKEYAVPVHEGHRIVAKGGRDTGKRVKANPWMERAVNMADSEINKIFDQAADRVAQRLVS